LSGNPAQHDDENKVAKANPFGGKYLFRYDEENGKNYILVEKVPGDIALSLDQKYDDGDYSTGSIRTDNGNGYDAATVDQKWYVF